MAYLIGIIGCMTCIAGILLCAIIIIEEEIENENSKD